MQTTDPSRIKPLPLFSPSPRAGVAPPGLTQALLKLGSGYRGWTLPEVGCPVWTTCKLMALAAPVQLAAAREQTHPASDLVLALTRPAMKMTIALSLSWTRSLRTRTPIRILCRARLSGRGGLARFNPKPPLENHHGDPGTTELGEAPSTTRGGSHLLATETLSDHSPIHSRSHYDTQIL